MKPSNTVENVEIIGQFWHSQRAVSNRRITIRAESHVGQIRKGNEDSFGVWEPGDPGGLRTKGRLVTVCDGMGGGVCGLTASRLAVNIILTEYRRGNLELSVSESLKKVIESANQAVFKAGLDNDRYRGMGTTATAMVLLEEVAIVGHVGDSRAYLVRDGTISQITEDHTLVMRLVKTGRITAEQAKDHPQSHIITRCIGGKPRVEVDIIGPKEVRSGDRFVLCSDGLYGFLTDDDIFLAAMDLSPREACTTLVEQANAAGGGDNITVLIVSIDDEDQ